MSEPSSATRQQEFQRLMEHQEPGIAQAIVTFEAVERIYFNAVAATPQSVAVTTHATTTARR